MNLDLLQVEWSMTLNGSESMKLTRHDTLAEFDDHMPSKSMMVIVVGSIPIVGETLKPCCQFCTKLPEISDWWYFKKNSNNKGNCKMQC